MDFLTGTLVLGMRFVATRRLRIITKYGEKNSYRRFSWSVGLVFSTVNIIQQLDHAPVTKIMTLCGLPPWPFYCLICYLHDSPGHADLHDQGCCTGIL